jgi:DNA-binding GntR family transcriptional regulator
MNAKASHQPGASRRRLAYEHILGRLVAGEFRAGGALREIPLAKEIGVSRTPVREAIGQLVAEGVLREIPGRGASFVEPTRRDVIELYELREALEVYAVGKAARQGIRRKESEALGHLVEEVRESRLLLEKSGQPVLKGDLLQRFLVADYRFHVLLLQSAGNERIAKAAADARLLIRIFAMQRERHSAALLQQIESYHCDTLEAVRRGDAEQARRVLGEHIRLSMEERLAEYENSRSADRQGHIFETF